MATKTDNHDLHAKLDLRRYFLRKYHADAPPRVLDCCQGGGVIWRRLREEFTLASYWGIDKKSAKGRLAIAAERVLAQPGWRRDVVDIDTYGSPWKIWEAMLPNVSQPTTVFLTMAWVTPSVQQYDKASMLALGIGSNITTRAPKTVLAAATRLAPPWAIWNCVEHHLSIAEAVEASTRGNARYFGIRLEPLTDHGKIAMGGHA